MSRIHEDWLTAYCQYASFGEAPRRMYFWTGVSAVAGALRRRVWIEQKYFRWYPNFYIFLVAPPGIVSKSTTASVAMNLLRQVPGIHFGPDVVTWQALVGCFVEAGEAFEWNGNWHEMSAITIESSELGNLLNPQDKEMVDLLVSLWDGRNGFEKRTKMSGNDTIKGPWINILACTTPAWIAGNFPEYIVGGGLTSRCVFVYAEEKERYVAYPHMHVPAGFSETGESLASDLAHIATNLAGEFTIEPDALEWGIHWYEEHYRNRPPGLDDDRFGGYIARKQTHIHKLAMVLSASRSDSLCISLDDLQSANAMVTDLEQDMPKVFHKIGRGQDSIQAERLMDFIRRRKVVDYAEAYRYIYAYFPDLKDFEGIMAGIMKAGLVRLEQRGAAMMLVALDPTGN